MIMFTFSVRNIPPHQSPQEHEAFKDNFLGVKLLSGALFTPSETSKLPGAGGRRGQSKALARTQERGALK